ncbi:MAG TPA: AAA family ATPase [Thermotogota bacterium]|nr:AAA family ATPase [Thermotogota bacterium]
MKRWPIGISDFRRIREEGYLFVDTSCFISEIWKEDAQTILVTRPRRFGKTLNLSMLSHFFDIRLKSAGLFKDLRIASDSLLMEQMNRVPTIFLSFKDIKDSDWDSALFHLKMVLSSLFQEFSPILLDVLGEPFLEKSFQSIVNLEAHVVQYKNALKTLIDLLFHKFQHPVLLLIDEYDVPIQSAWTNGYFDQMIDFMRVFLSAPLKDNPKLHKGVLTGIFRVAKESIFSGLNNLVPFTVLEDSFSAYFGFSPREVEWLVAQKWPQQQEKASQQLQQLQEWYNGYRFGQQTVYNPWSVINFLKANRLKPYWIHSSSNDLVIEQVEKNLRRHPTFRAEMERLLSGDSIEKVLDDATALREIDQSPSAIWTLFLFSGYLTPEAATLEQGKYRCTLRIPNEEVQLFFQDTISTWLTHPNPENLSRMLQDLLEGNAPGFANSLQQFALDTLSYYDLQIQSENTFHVLLLGLLAQLQSHFCIRSNRESGFGRYDILLEPRDPSLPGIVIEVKAGTHDLPKALEQIQEKQYTRELLSKGIKELFLVAIGTEGKKVEVLTSESQR